MFWYPKHPVSYRLDCNCFICLPCRLRSSDRRIRRTVCVKQINRQPLVRVSIAAVLRRSIPDVREGDCALRPLVHGPHPTAAGRDLLTARQHASPSTVRRCRNDDWQWPAARWLSDARSRCPSGQRRRRRERCMRAFRRQLSREAAAIAARRLVSLAASPAVDARDSAPTRSTDDRLKSPSVAAEVCAARLWLGAPTVDRCPPDMRLTYAALPRRRISCSPPPRSRLRDRNKHDQFARSLARLRRITERTAPVGNIRQSYDLATVRRLFLSAQSRSVDRAIFIRIYGHTLLQYLLPRATFNQCIIRPPDDLLSLSVSFITYLFFSGASPFAHPFPNFYRGSNAKYFEIWSKFGHWGGVISKQSNGSKIWKPCWKQKRSAKLPFKYDVGRCPNYEISCLHPPWKTSE